MFTRLKFLYYTSYYFNVLLLFCFLSYPFTFYSVAHLHPPTFRQLETFYSAFFKGKNKMHEGRNLMVDKARKKFSLLQVNEESNKSNLSRKTKLFHPPQNSVLSSSFPAIDSGITISISRPSKETERYDSQGCPCNFKVF